MKRSEAAKYARWSALAAFLLASLTIGVYLERKWVAYREQQKAPPPAPKDVTRSSNGLTFSQGLGTQTVFKVEASKSDRKSTRLNSSHRCISYAVFCLKKKTQQTPNDDDPALLVHLPY